eukprot:784059-Ditylum_brightwellii.AAC.1
MYLPSKWQPLDWMLPPIILYRLTTFSKQIEPLFAKRYGRNNLLPHHQRALRLLKSQSQFLIIQFNKNMGPAIIEHSIYIRRALEHL